MNVTLLKNSVANVLRGFSGALVALLLPPFLTRYLPDQTYGAWVLVLQLSAYVAYLDFGVQTAVGRYVAHTTELNDEHGRDQYVSTALFILLIAAVLGLILVIGLSLAMPHLFPKMPEDIRYEAQTALLVVGGSLVIGLPFSVFSGIFVGLQRNEIPALIVGGSKLIGALAVIIVASQGGNLVAMATALAASNGLAAITQHIVARHAAPLIQINTRAVNLRVGRELLDYCFSLTVWSLAMLLITGLDTVVVGYFDFNAVSYYAVAATLVLLVSGLQNAVFSVLMPRAAILGARNDADGLGKLLVTATRYSTLMLLVTGLPLVFLANPILALWVGAKYAELAAPILQVLVIANIVRWSLAPYANILVGTGQQRLVTISPIVEGVTNLTVSILLAYSLGAIGVALGTLVGSIVAFLCNVFYNMPRTTGIRFSRFNYLRSGFVLPLLFSFPLCILGLIK
jgi:O-antigen/teichoic acid export membrane protein